MIADLFVYELGDVILLTMSGDVTATVLGKLDQFIFSEDVQLGDVTGTFAQIAIVGFEAATAVAAIVSGMPADALREMAEHLGLAGLTYNVSGNEGIHFRLQSGGRVLVGTQRPAEFAAAIAKAMGARGTR